MPNGSWSSLPSRYCLFFLLLASSSSLRRTERLRIRALVSAAVAVGRQTDSVGVRFACTFSHRNGKERRQEPKTTKWSERTKRLCPKKKKRKWIVLSHALRQMLTVHRSHNNRFGAMKENALLPLHRRIGNRNALSPGSAFRRAECVAPIIRSVIESFMRISAIRIGVSVLFVPAKRPARRSFGRPNDVGGRTDLFLPTRRGKNRWENRERGRAAERY